MKIQLLLLIAISLIVTACSKETVLPATVDKDKASIELMNALIPQLRGTWTLKQLQIKAQSSTFHGELRIKKDTVLSDFAILDLQLASKQFMSTQTRYEGKLHYKDRIYPIRLDLIAGNWIYSKEGPQAFFLLDYNYPAGYSGKTEQEAYFLERIGLLLETFSLSTTIGEPTMTWRGLNRGIEQLTLIKQ